MNQENIRFLREDEIVFAYQQQRINPFDTFCWPKYRKKRGLQTERSKDFIAELFLLFINYLFVH